VFQQVPIFSTNQVHTDYVDSVRWFGNCLLTKSTKNRVAYWSPDSNRYKGAPLVLREFELFGCEIWFVRMDICIPLDLLAVGNKFGKVFLFSLSGHLQSATVLPSSSTGANSSSSSSSSGGAVEGISTCGVVV
jgi:polycomb protein EED